MVRSKISQSSAQRQKRGHTAMNQQPDDTKTEPPQGLNNNGPFSKTEKNGVVHINGTTGKAEDIFDKIEELKSNADSEEVEESLSTDSLSDVSKFESLFPVTLEKSLQTLTCNHFKIFYFCVQFLAQT